MTCGERIVSDDYADILIDFSISGTDLSDTVDMCVEEVDSEFSVIYARREEIPPLELTEYIYSSIPKLYGLMQTGTFDPISLIRSGILQMQRPPLSLTGQGVVLAFIDTGEGVKIMSNRRNLSKHGDFVTSRRPMAGAING